MPGTRVGENDSRPPFFRPSIMDHRPWTLDHGPWTLDLVSGVALGHLDIDPGRIVEIRDVQADRRNLAIRCLELDPFGLELLEELGEALDFEPDVIDRRAAGAALHRLLGRCEDQTHAR